jgi:uncharacterized protein
MPMTRGRILVPVQHIADNESAEVPFEAPAAAIGLQDVPGSVHGTASVKRIDRRLVVTCVAEVARPAVCDRCLFDFEQSLRAEFELWYVIGGAAAGEEEALSIGVEDRYVALDEDVRENLILSVPMKTLCSDDCMGICPACGANRNEADCGHEEEIED